MREPVIVLAGLRLLALVLYWQKQDPWPSEGKSRLIVGTREEIFYEGCLPEL